VIENVEDLGAQFEPDFFRKLRDLEYGEIDILITRSDQRITTAAMLNPTLMLRVR
jgi:hypothetical protein